MLKINITKIMKSLFCILILLITIQKTPAQNESFWNMVDQYTMKTLPFITADSLHHNLSKYTILDARESGEYAVSHIKNAIHVGYENFSLKKTIQEIPKEKPVVIYCSIGYRSEKIGEQLQKKGYKVFNLYGGIFHWANKGLLLVDSNGHSTQKIHGYSEEWGKWLTKPEVVYEP